MITAWRSRSVNRRIFADTMVVGSFLSVVKVAGAAKVILTARLFGASDTLDSYLVAFLLPAFFADVIAGTLTSALVPALIDVRESHGRKAFDQLVSNIVAGSLIVLTAAVLLLALTSSLVLRLIASGFGDAKRELAQNLFYVLLPLVPLAGVSVAWRAALNAEERFAAAALAPAMTPLLCVALLAAAGPAASVWLLACASLAGMMLELVCLAAAVKSHGIPLLPAWTGWDPAIKHVVRQHLPLIAVAAIGGGNLLVDQSMAAMLGTGSVSALNFGTKLAGVLTGIAGAALSTAALPHFSRMIAAGQWRIVRRTVNTYARLVFLIGIPLTIALIAGSGIVVKVAFQGGAFDNAAAASVTAVQRMSLLQLPLAVFLAMLLRLVSSLSANALLVRVALVTLLVNIIADYVLMRILGVPGIALSSSLVQMTSMIYVMVLVRKRMPQA